MVIPSGADGELLEGGSLLEEVPQEQALRVYRLARWLTSSFSLLCFADEDVISQCSASLPSWIFLLKL